MAFNKGTSGNPNGRPRGAKDKKNEKIRKWLLDIVESRRDLIADDLDTVDAATRLNFIAKILPYVVPRLASVDMAQNSPASNPTMMIITADEMEKAALEKMGNEDGRTAVISLHKSGHTPASSEEEVLQRIQEEQGRRGD